MIPYNLIIADQDPTVRKLLVATSKQYGFKPVTVDNGISLFESLEDGVAAIILEIDLPSMDGEACLKELRAHETYIPVVILCNEETSGRARELVKQGASNYLCKPFDEHKLYTVLRNTKKFSKVQRAHDSLKQTVAHPPPLSGVVATSEVMKKALSTADKVAKLDSTVLLTGCSGTGKGVLARYIHSNSPRADKPFITVSCPALPRELLESELFGHEKGSFTGALSRRLGKIEAAKGGTLFLDEIGEIPLDIQPKFLNFLQDQEYTRIGGNLSIPSDVRIIAASNVDFKAKIESREFREDLYYRISVIPIMLPDLRDRREDIIDLAEHFAARASKRHNIEAVKLSDEVKEILLNYDWPGNVRQLENQIERCCVFCEDGVIKKSDLSGEIHKLASRERSLGLGGRKLMDIEKEAIEATLELCGGNKAETARQLGITERSIYNKIKRHEIEC